MMCACLIPAFQALVCYYVDDCNQAFAAAAAAAKAIAASAANAASPLPTSSVKSQGEIGRYVQWAEFRGGVLNASSGETFSRCDAAP